MSHWSVEAISQETRPTQFEESKTMRFGQPSRRTLLQTALAAFFVLSIPTLTLAQGKGGGKKGGGGDDPPTAPVFTAHPTVQYELNLIAYPTNETATSGYALEINDMGCAAGIYETVDSGTQSWFFDPSGGLSQSVDLRDLMNVALPAGTEVLARGLNDFNIIVGGLIYADGEIDGFSLDVNTGDLNLLPSNPAWDYAVGIEVNNNGDIMGRIWWPDGTLGNYLYHPGSEGVASTLEFVNVSDLRSNKSHMNEAAAGEPTVVVGVTNPDSKLFIHAKGGETEVTNIDVYSAHVADSGTIFGRLYETTEVQVRKNKTETVRELRFYQLTSDDGLKIYSSDEPTFYIEDLNNEEVAMGRHVERINTGSGSYYFDYVLSHFAGLGVIDIGGSVVDADKDEWATLFRDGGFNNGLANNNYGPGGAGEVVGASNSTIFLLTPVSK